MNVDVEYIESFEQMLETALAEDSINNARPMTDIEIQCLVIHVRQGQPQENFDIYQDLKKTLFNMIELIKQEKNSVQELYARKLLRRVGEVTMNINTVTPNIVH